MNESAGNKKAGRYDIRGIAVTVLPEDKKLAEELFDSLALIPAGKKALDDMAKYKTGFYLESGLKNADAFFEPENSRIVLDKSLDPAAMRFNLIHEARHLWQSRHGRTQAEAQNPDFASCLMIDRATEADAQTQAFQACLEWRELGDSAPMKQFVKRDALMAAAYEKSRSLSDVFKSWYDNELVVAAYEHNYGTAPYLNRLDEEPEKRPFYVFEALGHCQILRRRARRRV